MVIIPILDQNNKAHILTYKQPDQFGFVYISFKKIGDTEKITSFKCR